MWNLWNFLKKLFCWETQEIIVAHADVDTDVEELSEYNHPEGVVISCYFNPQDSPYRLKAFNEFYEKIKHLNHRIIECVIGDFKPQLPENENIVRVQTKNLLWHKEALLNKVISELSIQYKYIFWVDADVIFTNPFWFYDGVESLKEGANVVQPFEYCIHLRKDKMEPDFDVDLAIMNVHNKDTRNKEMWRSFCANFIDPPSDNVLIAANENYDLHGHVGFAWGAKREILEQVPLYDKALIGGADHIIAHAAAGHIPHHCITKSFSDNIDEVLEWSRNFYNLIEGKIGYVEGELYHIWHGDIANRQYLKRIQDFTKNTKNIVHKDKNGLYVTDNEEYDQYMRKYYRHREFIDYDLFDPFNPLNYVNPLSPFYMMDMDNVALNYDPNVPNEVQFGGGEFGGAGAGSSWGDEQQPLNEQNNVDIDSSTVTAVDDQSQYNSSENFS